MHMRLRRLLAVAVVGALTGLVPSPPPAAAESLIPEGFADHKVLMGANDLDVDERRFEYHAYYPTRLQVHQGDVVWFDSVGFHSVTFWPNGDRQAQLFRADEVPGGSVDVDAFIQIPSAFPDGPTCAIGPQVIALEPCAYTGPDAYVSTGLPTIFEDFGARIRFDAGPGVYAYHCLLHRDMEGEIEVVPEDVPVATPDEVEAQRQAEIAADAANAERTFAELTEQAKNETEVFEDETGERRLRRTVYVGGTTADGRVSSLRFHPDSVDLAPGDEVAFKSVSVDTDHFEYHTATFIDRESAGLAFLSYWDIACDPDDSASGAVGMTMLTSIFTACPNGWTQEFRWSPAAYRVPVRAPGSLVIAPDQVHDSGLFFVANDECIDRCDPWTGEPVGSEDPFVARLPVEGNFGFSCLIHPGTGMHGAVTVRAG